MTELRKEITEIDAAICVAWAIIYSRRQGIDLTPDEVSSEMVSMTEKQFIRLNKRPLVGYLTDCYLVDITIGNAFLCEDDVYPLSIFLCDLRNT